MNIMNTLKANKEVIIKGLKYVGTAAAAIAVYALLTNKSELEEIQECEAIEAEEEVLQIDEVIEENKIEEEV